MFKLFDRYILKEISSPFFVGLLAFTLVLLMNQILYMSELFIEREIPFELVLVLLVYLVPSILAFTLPMSVLLGILAGLSRMSSDIEITALKTLGVSYKRLARPLLVFAFCGWILTSYLSFYLAPHANHQWTQTLYKVVLSKVQLRINPREFNENIPNTMLFVQDVTQDNVWKNIIVYISDPPDEPLLVYSKTGRINFYPEQQRAYLELFDGVQHSYPHANPEELYRVFTFERLQKNVDVSNFFPRFSENKTVREKDLDELFADIRVIQEDLSGFTPEEKQGVEYWQKNRELTAHRIEIHKKFSIPFACFIFALLGLPLGATTKKGGRTSGFTISILVIIIYYVLITAGEQMAKEGRISAEFGMWGPNIFFGLSALVLFFFTLKESFRIPFPLRLFRRKEQPAVPAKTLSERHRRLRLLRFPNILDRYIIRKFLVIFLLILISLLFVSIIITFFERIDEIYEHNKPFSLFLNYLWYRIPEFVYVSLPVCAMASALLSLGLLTKTNEITAMKACGMSVYRIIIPVVAAACLVSIGSFYIQEYIYPYSNKKAEEKWNEIIDRPPRSYSHLDQRWVMGRERNRIYHYKHFDPFVPAFSELSIYEFEPDSWSLQKRYFAEKGYFKEDRLLLINGWYMEFEENKQTRFVQKETLELFDLEGRNYFVKEWKEADQLNYSELAAYIEDVEEKGFETVHYRVDLNYKVSFPLAGLVMTLLGIPFAFSMGKRGTLVGMGLSLLIAMVYWGAMEMFRFFGYQSFLFPFLAAWGPNLIFGLAGLYLLFTLRT
ncbi:MAG: LPS export ABC transporter permease LptF [Candidatus Aminicenantes bacterium]